MSRCANCRRFIWPWQHYGMRVTLLGSERRWHVRCTTEATE